MISRFTINTIAIKVLQSLALHCDRTDGGGGAPLIIFITVMFVTTEMNIASQSQS